MNPKKLTKPGDIFVIPILSYKNENKCLFVWGKVLKTGLRSHTSFTENSNLVQIYNIVTNDISRTPKMSKDDLLIPPTLIINDYFFSKNPQFILLDNEQISQDDLLEYYIFGYLKGPMANRFHDEYGNPVNKEDELSSYYTSAGLKKVKISLEYIDEYIRNNSVASEGLSHPDAIISDILESLIAKRNYNCYQAKDGIYEKVIDFGTDQDLFDSADSKNLSLVLRNINHNPKTKKTTTIAIKIKIADLNNPDMDMLTLEELFEDIVGKKPFTKYYQEYNRDPLAIVLETTNKNEAEKIIKQKMDSAIFFNPKTNKDEKLFKDYTIEISKD
jgi:hypothetical protein